MVVSGKRAHPKSAQNFTHGTEQSQCQGKAQTDTHTVGDARQRSVFAGEGFGTAQYHTVDHNQRDIDAQTLVDIGQISLDKHLENGDEGSDDHYEDRYAHLVGGDVLDAGDDKVGTYQHCHRGQTHHQSVGGTCGGSQCGTHAQEQYECGILLDDAVFDYIE